MIALPRVSLIPLIALLACCSAVSNAQESNPPPFVESLIPAIVEAGRCGSNASYYDLKAEFASGNNVDDSFTPDKLSSCKYQSISAYCMLGALVIMDPLYAYELYGPGTADVWEATSEQVNDVRYCNLLQRDNLQSLLIFGNETPEDVEYVEGMIQFRSKPVRLQSGENTRIRGNLYFAAKKEGDQWRVTEFILPVRKVRLINQGEGKWWQASDFEPRPVSEGWYSLDLDNVIHYDLKQGRG